MADMALKKKPQEFICYCIKAWSGETGHAHIEADKTTSTKCIQDLLNSYCKPRSDETVAATTCKQLLQGDLSLLEYVEKCKDVTVVCNFGTAYENA